MQQDRRLSSTGAGENRLGLFRRCLNWAMICLMASTWGCSGHPFPVVPVSGVITYDGEPLAEATINFEPIGSPPDYQAGPGSFATTDAEGKFELRTTDKRTGAVVASHRVTIQTFRAERGTDTEIRVVAKERLPNIYHANSKLKFDVPAGGTSSADFHLTPQG
jgi:hypothetical protein